MYKLCEPYLLDSNKQKSALKNVTITFSLTTPHKAQ